MTTIIFRDDKIIFDDKLLTGIPLFDSINKHDFKESEEKTISLDCYSSDFLLIMKYKLALIDDDKYSEGNVINLCDYLCLDEIKQKYLDSQNNEFLLEKKIISKKEYMFGLIIEKESEIYFDNEKHFENFLESPNNVKYYDNDSNRRNNILFYLAYEKYDLMEEAIDYGLFDKIDINKSMIFYDNYTRHSNILIFSCLFSKKYSSNKTVKILLEHPNINVNLQSEYGWSALMSASGETNTDSTEETVKMLLEHPNIDVNLQNEQGYTALTHACRYSNTDSTEKTVKILLEHPNIDVNLQDIDGWSALMLASKYSNTDSTEETVKMLLEHSNIDVNLQDIGGWSALMMASRYSNADSTEKTVKILLKHPNIDINLQTKNDSSALMLASRNTNTDSTEKTVKILLEHPDIDVKSKKTNFWSRYFGY